MIRRQNLVRIIVSLAGLGLLVFLLCRLGPNNVLSLFRQISWRFLVIVLIYGTEELVRAAALRQCLPRESCPAFRTIVHIRLIGEAVRAVTLTGPLLSEPTRAWLIRKQGVRSSEAVAATIGEYAANTFVSAFLTVAGVIYLFKCLEPPDDLRVAGSVLLCASAGYMVGVVIALSRRARFLRSVATRFARLPGMQSRTSARLESAGQTGDALFLALRDRPGTPLRLLALECVAQTLLLVETYWSLISMGLNTSFLTASLAEILTKLANVAFVGVAEGAYVFLFHALALPVTAGFTLALVKRLRSLALAVIGLASLSLISIRSPRRR